MYQPPLIPQLTPDERPWRIDWFGEVGYPGHIRRYAQPSIKVSLSPLRCDPAEHAALLFSDSTDHQHQYEAWAPIAALPMLSIGDLWQVGQQIASPNYQVEAFKSLAINPESTAFVKAGLALEEHFLLPLSHHPWHRHHTQSYCVAVSLDEQHRLLVPCVEIIRFYFGSSSNFLQRLFTAPLSQDNFWTHKHFNPATRHLHLVLANRLSGLSAPDIGRIAESRFAWRAAAGVYASCQKATATGHPAYPYTGFPFEGTTDLIASGLWLPFGDQECATFLAYRLHSCSHPFPFKSLSYEATDRKVWHSNAGSQDSTGGRVSREPKRAKSEAVDSDPDVNKTQRSTSYRSMHRFPDLVRKQIWRERLETMPKPDVLLRRANGSLEPIAFGESDGFSGATGIDITKEDHYDSGTSTLLPRFVDHGLKIIAQGAEYAPFAAKLKVVCPVGKITPVFSLPVVIDEDGEIASRLLFTTETSGMRQRRACFVEVMCEASERYLLIVEGQTRSERTTVLSATSRATELAAISVLTNEALMERSNLKRH